MNSVDNIINNIGLKIKYYRNLNNISLSKLAKEANISKSTLFGLEEGKSNPTISTLISLSKTLNIHLSELIDDALENKQDSISLTLLEEDSKNSKYIYKLILLPNEYINLNFSAYDSIEIELLSGQIADIDRQRVLPLNRRVNIPPNSRLKSLNGDATAIVYVKTFENNIYCKDDLFFKKPTIESINSLIDISKSTTIVRAIFDSIYPVEFPSNRGYTQIVEVTKKKETHYYVYTILKGLVKGIDNLSLKLNGLNSLVKEKLNLLKRVAKSESIFKDELLNFNKHPIVAIDRDIVKIIKKEYQDIEILDSSKELTNSLKNSYIAVIDDFIDSADSYSRLKEKSLTIWLYRALELLLPLQERELTINELKLYNILREELPKAYYFAKTGVFNLALETTKTLIDNLDIKIVEESQIVTYFKEIETTLQNILQNLHNMGYISTLSSFENSIEELDLDVILKEAIHPTVYGSKYVYILKPKSI